MKKLSALLGYLLLAVFLFPAVAQQEQPLPVDPQLRYGKLPNGLTYYIRHNGQPKDRADFYIAQRVGSMQEEDSQSGLAHFLEHMAFNGTEHFPGKKLSDYLETIGVRFGDNLNAYTGFDETVYMIQNVPTVREGIVDSCLLILHDWSNAISLEDEEIDKERGVIHEEWRTRNNAQIRLLEKQLPALMPGSKYAERMPIGKMEVVDNFPPDTLRNYYKKWYRPDLQAVIVVGDIDVDRTEAELKKIFRDVPAPVDPAERIQYPVPDTGRPLAAVITDKEAPNTVLSIYYKHDIMPEEQYATRAGAVRDYLRMAAASLVNNRLDELVHTSNPPFIYAGGYGGNYLIARTKDAWVMAAVAKEGEIGNALSALIGETRRIEQFGFTPEEYERVKTNLLQRFESLYKDRDKQKNNLYVNEYVKHFTEGGYIPGIEAEYALIREIAAETSVEDVNRFIRNQLAADDIALLLTGPEKEGLVYPTSEELLRMYREALQQEVTPYGEQLSDEPLVGRLPAPGKIVSVKENPTLGATELTLSNGVRVALKKTGFKKDEIRMTATRPGGTSLFDTSDKVNYQLMVSAVEGGGLGNFSAVDLRKKLAGKRVSLSPGIGPDCEKLDGSISPEDLETLFQLIYLTFTAPRKDTVAYQSFVSRLKDQLRSQEVNPMAALSDTLSATLYDSNPRMARLKAADLEKADYDRMLELYRERFGDATGFLFTFVGNIDLDSVRPYIEQYLATLPATGKPQRANEKNIVPLHKGKVVKHFRRAMETPKATVADFYTGQTGYTLENLIAAAMLEQILDMVYTEKVREEEGGTYGVGVGINVSPFPAGRTVLQATFNTDPARFEALNRIVHAELARLAEAGPRETDFNKTKENMLKNRAEQLQENGYWLSVLDDFYFKGFDRYSRYDELLQGMTPEKVRDFAKKLLAQGNEAEIVMLPTEKPAAAGK